MFQVDWCQQEVWKYESHHAAAHKSSLNRELVRKTSLLYWEEHCHECAVPFCYSSCSLFIPRADKRCARFAYGIYPNPGFSGLFDFGADIRFRRWGKLETQLVGKSASVRYHRALDRINRFVMHSPGSSSSGQRAFSAQSISSDPLPRFGKSFLAKVRAKYLTTVAPRGENIAYDDFVLECFSPEGGDFRLTLEYFDRQIRSRHSFNIKPGWNSYRVPVETFKFKSNPPAGKLTLFPENDAERRLVFTWLDLVQYRAPSKSADHPVPAKQPTPAAKVKCVAWDLDNTLWAGVVAEDSERDLRPRPEALELIKALDERGILQTIASKNNVADAWPIIERLGLNGYFLLPAINWQPKSSNLTEIAANLNINLDSFALIDDSPFERAEVQTALPQVRVYSDNRISSLLTSSEFDVPISEASRERRNYYLREIGREKIREASENSYEAFLRSCEMKLKLFVPRGEQHIKRCLELIQRANQLNLSNTRYTADEFGDLLSQPGMLCIAMDCSDRFGAYGIVGFAALDERGDVPVLRDMVLSCRVARKRVEHAFIHWLGRRELARAGKLLAAELVRTDRNMPILQVFDDLHFQARSENGERCTMELSLDSIVDAEDIVLVETEPGLVGGEIICPSELRCGA